MRGIVSKIRNVLILILLTLFYSPLLIDKANALAGNPALGLLVTSDHTNEILIYDGITGRPAGIFASTGGLDDPRGFTIGPDGDVYVVSRSKNAVFRYDGPSGVFKGIFISSGSGGLTNPIHLAFGLEENVLVTDTGNDRILNYDGNTGEFLNVFVPEGVGDLDLPNGILLHTDGLLYVLSSLSGDKVIRYDGRTGEFVDTFVPSRRGGLNDPQDLTFGPDGDLYVSSGSTDEVLRYDGRTGNFVEVFVSEGSGGLNIPKGIEFGADGNLYVASFNSDEIILYDGETGSFLSAFVSPRSGGLDGPIHLSFVSLNEPPTQPTVQILPEDPDTSDPLFAVAKGSIDPNLEPVDFNYAWLIDGLQVELTPGKPVSGPVLNKNFTAPGQVVECVVVPTDGNLEGTAAFDSVIISTTPCSQIDLFPDGFVDPKDLLLFLNHWRSEVCSRHH